MKKNIASLILSTLLLLPFLTGCNDLVFSNILEDVVPEEATVNGSINSITRYTVSSQEYLVTYSTNGIIYKSKDDDFHGAWHKYTHLPFELHYYDYYETTHFGQQIIKTAADENNLYIVTVEYANHPSLGTNYPKHFYIWSAKITSWDSEPLWTDLNADDSIAWAYREGNYYYTDFNVFCTNAPMKAHRKAFARNKNNQLYELKGTTVSTSISATHPNWDIPGDGKMDSVVYFGNAYYLLDGMASTTNETYSANPTHVYFAQDKSSRVYFNVNPGSISESNRSYLDAGEAVSCLAITKNALLIGRANAESSSASYGGIVKANATDWVPETSLSSFTTNAAAQMPSSYLINTLLAIDSGKNETETAIYGSIIFRTIGTSSSVNYDNVGLWSYYPSRGNWNRE